MEWWIVYNDYAEGGEPIRCQDYDHACAVLTMIEDGRDLWTLGHITRKVWRAQFVFWLEEEYYCIRGGPVAVLDGYGDEPVPKPLLEMIQHLLTQETHNGTDNNSLCD
jgi:hypothetical protein